MKSGSWSSFVAAQEVGFFGYPDDADDYQSDVQAADEEACGADSENLLTLGYSFDLCRREPGHPGFHEYIAL